MDESRQTIPSSSPANPYRKVPFTQSERELIVALVKERPIIENKRTNAKNNELKRRAWDELAKVFNRQPYVSKRSSQQLRRCWENMKTLKKKELFQEFTIIRTGGEDGSTSSNHEENDETELDNLTLDEPEEKKFKTHLEYVSIDYPEAGKKTLSETDARIERCTTNIQQDQELHELRLQKERIIIQREKNQLEYEKEMHKLQLEKIKLEINLLKKQ